MNKITVIRKLATLIENTCELQLQLELAEIMQILAEELVDDIHEQVVDMEVFGTIVSHRDRACGYSPSGPQSCTE